MPRLFTTEVYKDQIAGTGTFETMPDLNEVLGRADVLVVQVRGLNATGTSPTLTMKYWHSNDGVNFVTAATLLSAVAFGDVYETVVDTSGTELGAYGKFTFELGGTGPAVYLAVTVCGRTN